MTDLERFEAAWQAQGRDLYESFKACAWEWWQAALVAASKPAASQDERIDQLERALVYVAHTMHGEPQYRLAEGITLGDVSYVRVRVGDVDVQVNISEASARTLYAAARDTTERKVAERGAASPAAPAQSEPFGYVSRADFEKGDPTLVGVKVLEDDVPLYASPQLAQTERALTDEQRSAVELAQQVLRQIEAGDGVFVKQCSEAIDGLETLLAAAQPASGGAK